MANAGNTTGHETGFQNLTKEITRLEKSNVKLSLTIPRDEVRSRYQLLLKDYTKTVQIPGFRRGKVPQEVLERKFGESLKGEALGRIIEAAISSVFDDPAVAGNEKPLPYSTPEIQDEPKLDFDRDLSFSVVYDVLPDVRIGQWKGLEVEAPVAEISDEDMARELEDVRERNSVVLDKDDDATAQKGDVVTIDYCEIGENGEVLPASEREDFVFALGTGRNIYQIDEEITGMKKGETREFTKVYPADFSEAALAGKTVKMRVRMSALKEKKLPDLDDDLAQDVDENFNTLEDLKNSIRERLNKSLEQRLRELKINAVLEKIMENTPVILPESMVRAEIEGRMRNVARRFNAPVEQVMKMLSAAEGSLDDAENQWRPNAEKALHSRLIVETLLKELKLEAGDEEVEKEIENIAAETEADLEEVKEYYGRKHIREYLKDDLEERKLFDLLLAENTVKPGKKENYLDLMSNNG